MPRQFLNPAPVLHDILGLDPAFNGSLTFYEIGTTTPKDTWSDYDQTILNQNPVPLDSSARTDTQVWGEGEYTIVLRNAAGETVWTRDWRPEQAGSDALPAKESGKFLTTDGSQWLMADILQVPDPTGFSGRILSTDGANMLWIPIPEAPEPPEPPDPAIVVEESAGVLASFLAGVSTEPANLYIQTGTDTATPTGGNSTTKAVVFNEAFEGTPWVLVIPTGIAVGSGWQGIPMIQTKNSSGFTVRLETNAGNDGTGAINQPIPFDWIAFGIKDVA